MTQRLLVLDANIFIRAVLGNKVRRFLIDNTGQLAFFTPSQCLAEARHYLPLLLAKRGVPSEPAMAVLDGLLPLITILEVEELRPLEAVSRARLRRRDENDWPILAAALLLDCPVWTEDGDFFGVGVATWTTSTIGLYIES